MAILFYLNHKPLNIILKLISLWKKNLVKFESNNLSILRSKICFKVSKLTEKMSATISHNNSLSRVLDGELNIISVHSW